MRTYTANITEMPYQTNVRYKIIAYDNSNNSAVKDNNENFYTYTVIPEFSSAAIILLFFVATLIAAVYATISATRMLPLPAQNKNSSALHARILGNPKFCF